MRKTRRIAAYPISFALVALITGTTLGPKMASAQTNTPSWSLTGNLNTPRYGHTATLLPNGKVLVAGGAGPTSCSASPTRTAELYDPVTGTWSVTGNLSSPRFAHSATLLQNGKVLIVGGSNFDPAPPAELYDPATGTWQVTGSFNTIRTSGSATLLPNGKVLAVGMSNAQLISAELYDPGTATWSNIGAASMVPSLGHTALLPNGKVLAVNEGNPWDYGLISSELYNPTTAQWSTAGGLNLIWAVTVTMLRNSKVLVTGLYGANHPTRAELYDSATGAWSTTGDLNTFRHYGGYTVTVLTDGRVLVAGGLSYPSGDPLSAEELYEPATGTWVLTRPLTRSRRDHTATLLRSGRVLVAGGVDGLLCNSPVHSSAELYDPGNIPTINPIDDPGFFLLQHYLDFLDRDPDSVGLTAWLALLNNCQVGDTTCDRIHVSSAFFRSPEFQGRGYFVYRFYPVAFGRKPDYHEFRPDLFNVSGFLTDAELESAKLAFIAEFMNRPAFVTKFSELDNTAFVDTLLTTAGITHPSRDFWIAALGNGTRTRAQVLREICESNEVYNKYYNQAFVVMQYFGYLRRQPDALYLNWIAHLDATGDYRSMINGFVNSIEYRARFESPWNY